MTVTADDVAGSKPGARGPGRSRARAGTGGAAEPRGPGCAGEASPDAGSAGLPCRVRAGQVAGSGGAAAGPGEEPGTGAGAGPARADAGVPVHVLPGGGAADGGGSGRNPRVGAAGAAVRGCAPVQFRRVRLAGAAAGLRRQRLRRDPARPVRVGRQAAGRQPGRGRPGQRVHRQDPPQDRPGGGRGLPHGDARLRRAAAPGRVVCPPGHRAGHRRASGPGQGGKIQGCPGPAGQGAYPGQHPGAGQAHHRGRRAAADHQRPADDRPGRGRLRRSGRRRDLRAAPRRAGQVPAHPAVRPAAPARSSSRWSRWPARSSGSAASAPAPGSC